MTIDKSIRIWTWGNRPFTMGGKVRYPLATDVYAEGPFNLGKNITGYLITAPNGTTFVAESTTGALVGPNIEQVKQDINQASTSVIKQQIIDAENELPNLEVVSSDKFWTMLKCN